MTKVFKFVYALIILLFLFLVVTGANVHNCTTISDCSSNHCSYGGTPLCMLDQSNEQRYEASQFHFSSCSIPSKTYSEGIDLPFKFWLRN
ncbi:hypothetical protein P8452_45751 [Trifolium repens]|nr:hypothetical protein P8452_45751 [Trifolium repens]